MNQLTLVQKIRELADLRLYSDERAATPEDIKLRAESIIDDLWILRQIGNATRWVVSRVSSSHVGNFSGSITPGTELDTDFVRLRAKEVTFDDGVDVCNPQRWTFRTKRNMMSRKFGGASADYPMWVFEDMEFQGNTDTDNPATFTANVRTVPYNEEAEISTTWSTTVSPDQVAGTGFPFSADMVGATIFVLNSNTDSFYIGEITNFVTTATVDVSPAPSGPDTQAGSLLIIQTPVNQLHEKFEQAIVYYVVSKMALMMNRPDVYSWAKKYLYGFLAPYMLTERASDGN